MAALDLSVLNVPQRQAVEADPGVVLVLAGPGSGEPAHLERAAAGVEVADMQFRAAELMLVHVSTRLTRRQNQSDHSSSCLADRPRGTAMVYLPDDVYQQGGFRDAQPSSSHDRRTRQLGVVWHFSQHRLPHATPARQPHWPLRTV